MRKISLHIPSLGLLLIPSLMRDRSCGRGCITHCSIFNYSICHGNPLLVSTKEPLGNFQISRKKIVFLKP
jgi:hypothetical protein